MAGVVWSTGPRGDLTAHAHRMEEDLHGRPTTPRCGVSTHGLWLRAFTRWEAVPGQRRCPECDKA
jgi:rubredoxin